MPPQEQPTPQVQPPQHSRKTWWTLGVAALVILLIGAVSWWLFFYTKPNQISSTKNNLSITNPGLSASSTAQTSNLWVPIESATSSLYSVDTQGQVHYQTDKDNIIADADSTTLVVSPVFHYQTAYGVESDQWAKDKNHVYYGVQEVQGADPTTFDFLYTPHGTVELSYQRDKNFVYSSNFIQGTNAIPGSDPATFVVLTDDGYGFAQDKNNVYSNGNTVLYGVDSSTFTYIGNGYAKDSKYVYSVYGALTGINVIGSGLIVSGADPSTFQIVNPVGQCGSDCQYDALDKNHEYFQGEIVK